MKTLTERANLFLEEEPIEINDETGSQEELKVSEPVDVYFENLDEKTQKSIMDSLKVNLNITNDDDYSEKKIVEGLSKKPIFIINANEISRQMDFDL